MGVNDNATIGSRVRVAANLKALGPVAGLLQSLQIQARQPSRLALASFSLQCSVRRGAAQVTAGIDSSSSFACVDSVSGVPNTAAVGMNCAPICNVG